MKERLSIMKKRLIAEASPATIEELAKVGTFHTKGGYYNFLKRNKAKVTVLYKVEFPE